MAERRHNGRRFCDIGANLLDDRFIKGVYRGTYRHESDLDLVFDRARQAGVDKLILTAGSVADSRAAVQMARRWNRQYHGVTCYSTVGVHPTRCQQVFVDRHDTTDQSDEDLLQELLQIARDGQSDGTVVAIGEIGLDYDRLEFCPKDVQHKYLVRQLQVLASATKLPLFLHNRSVEHDLFDVLSRYRECWESSGGVVHSFDDTIQLAERFTRELNLSIGLNGCSLRTEQNLDTVRKLPLDRILLETDCPYCEVRSTHAGHKYIKTEFVAKAEKKFERGCMVKSRQEPCHLVQVAEAIAGCRDESIEDVVSTCYANSVALFRLCDKRDDDPIGMPNTARS